jgi:hypothetical protein
MSRLILAASSSLLLVLLVVAAGCGTSVRALAPKAGWRPDDEPNRASLVKPTLLWQGEPLVHPRGIMLDPSGKWLWVSDPGTSDSEPGKSPARIIRFPVTEGSQLGKPELFFQRPGFLWSAKWAIPVTIDGGKHLLVADQGEPKSEYEFSGKGAKVFVIPIGPDDKPGEPRVLWEGPPFVCPTGITLIGRYAIITDPCAGPMLPRKDRPDATFRRSAIFALSIEGGKPPILLQQGEPFTSLIGICPLVPGELIINDTDSGRLDPQKSAGRPGFAPQASADRWVFKIEPGDPPRLSPPVRTRFTEEGDLTLQLSRGSSKARRVLVRAVEGTSLVVPQQGEVRERDVTALVARGGRATVRVASNVMEETLCLDVIIDGRDHPVCVPKDPTRRIRFFDNKHGGSRERPPIKPPTTVITAIETGKGPWVYDRFTLDNNRNHGAVYVYPDGGGTPRAIAAGPPLSRPIAGQLTAKGDELWFVDQATACLYVLPFPSPEQFDEWFGPQRPLRY